MDSSGSDACPEGRSSGLSPARLAQLLETNPTAFVRLDREWAFTYVNARAESLLRLPREQLLGRSIWEAFPAGLGTVFEERYRAAVATGEAVTFEASFGSYGAWYEIRAAPDEAGLSLFWLDVSDRKRAYDRLSLVAEVSRALVGNREVETVARTLAELVVPDLATWAMVSLYDDEGRLYEAAAHHRDPQRAGDIRRLEELHPQLVSDLGIIAAATATGEAQLRTGLSAHISARAGSGNPLFLLLDRLGCDSVLLVPLRARARAVGVLALFHGADDGPMGEDALETTVAIADRAGLALENAQLYARQRRASEVLQRSMLTPLPQPDSLQLAGRYLPAAIGTEVGGDWYDAFTQPDGSVVLVIGDVVGHDITAAAVMGQLRNLLRGTAYDRADGPAALLERVDALIVGLDIDSLATALVARLSPGDGHRVLRWSSAGHPPPLLRRADGTVERLEAEPDLLLGMGSGTGRGEHSATLLPGDTLLLYTDGLVERHDRAMSVGIDALAVAFAETAPSPLSQACDELLARTLADRPDDDVALLAVHLGADGRRPDSADLPT